MYVQMYVHIFVHTYLLVLLLIDIDYSSIISNNGIFPGNIPIMCDYIMHVNEIVYDVMYVSMFILHVYMYVHTCRIYTCTADCYPNVHCNLLKGYVCCLKSFISHSLIHLITIHVGSFSSPYSY